MYWYPFSEEEEDSAWGQAEAQAERQGGQGAKKYVGNLGEITMGQFLAEYAGEHWSYLNEEAMIEQEPEYRVVDFKIGRSGLTVDVKSTVDIRKFDPVSMYYKEGAERMPGMGREGYPKVNVDNADVFVFVLISHARNIAPGSEIHSPDDVDEDITELPGGSRRFIKGRSGDRVATILGWVYAKEFFGEMVGNMNRGGRGKFTRMATRDMHELLLRADALPD